MKKILIITLMLSVAFGSIAIVRAAENGEVEREKIHSPLEIKNFRNIIKKGIELWGLRLRKLEKISHPAEIKNFEGIKRMGNALWGLRKFQPKPILVSPEAKQCVKDAIDKKDTSLKTALTDLNTTQLAAIDARNTCQKAALDKTTTSEQREANQECVTAYHKSGRAALAELKTMKKELWKTYKADLKTCSQLQSSTSSDDIVVEDGEDDL